MEDAAAGFPDEDTLIDIADLFKVFGDSTRVKILFALISRPMVVSELASTLGMTDSAISHQLAVLKANRLVRAQREGRSLRYALDDMHVAEILSIGREHLDEARSGADGR